MKLSQKSLRMGLTMGSVALASLAVNLGVAEGQSTDNAAAAVDSSAETASSGSAAESNQASSDASAKAQAADAGKENSDVKTMEEKKAQPNAIPAPQPKASAAAKQSADAPVATESTPPLAGAENFEVSTGARVSIEGKGFSIVPPEGWQIRRDIPRISLFMQIPMQNGIPYQRNISVIKFGDSRVMNDLTAQEFSQYLVQNFPRSSPEISQYQLRNHTPIQMSDGREGILFYTDFLARDVKMMQAHILVSSQTNHYLATYTDIAEHFENPQGNTQFLAEAWNAMVSVELDSASPEPLASVQSIAMVSGILVLLGIVISYVRNQRASALYRSYSTMEDGDEGGHTKTNAGTAGRDDLDEDDDDAKVVALKRGRRNKAKKEDMDETMDDDVDHESTAEPQWNVKGKGATPQKSDLDGGDDDEDLGQQWKGKRGA